MENSFVIVNRKKIDCTNIDSELISSNKVFELSS